MERALNFIYFIIVYVAVYALVYFCVSNNTVIEGAKSIAPFGLFVVPAIFQTIWKVHEAKKVDMLQAREARNLRTVARAINKRLFSLLSLLIVGVLLGFIIRFFEDKNIQYYVSVLAITFVIGTVIFWSIYFIILTKNIHDLQDVINEKARQEKMSENLLKKLIK